MKNITKKEWEELTELVNHIPEGFKIGGNGDYQKVSKKLWGKTKEEWEKYYK